jgi:hypothetical protein
VLANMLDETAPETCKLIWDMLPVESRAIHGMYSGAEIFVLMDDPQPTKPENQITLPTPGELFYFYDPGVFATSGGVGAEICLVYNRGVTFRGPDGQPTSSNFFARIPGDWQEDWKEFAAACRQCRWKGPQRLRIERVQ